MSVAATLRGMARTADDRIALVELKAVDRAYPMLGKLTLDPEMPVAELLAERKDPSGITFGAAADSTLLARLDLKIGDRVTVGNATFQIRSVVARRAGQIGRRHRFRPAIPGQRGRPARDRSCCSRAAWCAGSTG